MRVAIVGAGLAGLSCAQRLAGAGVNVVVFDKGRGPGGRMATRRMDTAAGPAAFDHGAQYFTVRDPGFRRLVDGWHQAGVAAPWPEAGPDCYRGVPGMSMPLKHMAAPLDVRLGVQVGALGRAGGDWRVEGDAFDTMVVATPAEQAAPLLAAHDAAAAALAAATVADPCWTLMVAFTAPVPAGSGVLRGGEAGRDGITWAARDSAKPGRGGPEAWVVQAGADWSRSMLERPAAEVAAALLSMFAEQVQVELPPVLASAAHRWRYAPSGAAGAGCVWRAETGLGVCGDWMIGPRVEAAWMSGDALATAILTPASS